MKLDQIFDKHSTMAIIGNRNSAKSSLALTKLLELRVEYPTLKIAGMGIEPSLNKVLRKHNITIIESKMDILDLQMTNTVLYIDELALFFDTSSKSKQLDKLERFFDRIVHNNCKLMVSTAREGYFNKFMCARIEVFFVKEIEYTALVNGTWLNERVKAITSNSDYRLECTKSCYYVVTNKEGITTKHSFPYMSILDTKSNNINLFNKKDDKKDDKKDENKSDYCERKPFIKLVEEKR